MFILGVTWFVIEYVNLLASSISVRVIFKLYPRFIDLAVIYVFFIPFSSKVDALPTFIYLWLTSRVQMLVLYQQLIRTPHFNKCTGWSPLKVIFTSGALPQIPGLSEVRCFLYWLTAHAKLPGLYGGFSRISAAHMKYIPTWLSHIEKGLVNFAVMADQALICYADSLDFDSPKNATWVDSVI